MEINQNKLIEEVNKGRLEYVTDGYAMSIGELLSNYKEGEININPDFQRKFRWTPYQRSRLIESILLGVPIPSIFVYQDEKGKWEVVDGVQRLSTIFEFMGELKDKEGNKQEKSELIKTKLLPSLEGMTWDKLPKEPLQIDFRRTKLEVKIIKRESHRNAKFEVFQRLNSGSHLQGQEFRNAALVMLNPDVFKWVENLATNLDFTECIDLTERWKEEFYDFELVLRLFVFAKYANKPIYKVDSFIDEYFIYNDADSIIQQIQDDVFNLDFERNKFLKTFELLQKTKGYEVFKKGGRGTQFLESYFEAIAIGLYSNIDSYSVSEMDKEIIRGKIDNIELKIPKAANTSSRIPLTVKFGKEYFKK